MAGDAVILDVEAAENLVSLQAAFAGAMRLHAPDADSPADPAVDPAAEPAPGAEWQADFGDEAPSKP